MSDPKRYRGLLTPANIVTVARIIFIPVFVFLLLAPWPDWAPDPRLAQLLKPWVAAAVFALLALTDGLDGYLARSRNEVSTFGKFLDPLADKILVTAALLALIELDKLPTWIALIILAREFLISGLRMVAAAEGKVIDASNLGKVKTVFQIIAVLAFILKDDVARTVLGVHSYDLYVFANALAWLFMLIALILTLLSLIDYFRKSAVIFGFGSGDAAAEASTSTVASHKSTEPGSGLAGQRHTADSTPALRATDQYSFEDAAVALVQAARAQNLTLGTAESCTGGLVAGALTSVPGSSEVFAGSIVSYVNEVKEQALGVSGETLKSLGAVSEEVACAMARGARQILDVTIAVSTTGIAGPGGGTAEKPVGTVWIGCASEAGEWAECHHFEGSRQTVREKAVAQALQVLSDAINERVG
ncbi:MAG: CDP-diacylglycerol--glycerol-3-phosphate 3-phosphatidyltransferase [Coriobacteriales bacterium]|jgi:CDP-diacylglycerol--glycerol-3-phosphate 3-phosphatidyltransferase|nr:CDP-diacylglycerol--glycerol-3-phosphate 3-phosphatidyltransferase [Coriobacteriales bacterium]